MFYTKDFKLAQLNLVANIIDDILQKKTPKETLMELTKRLDFPPAIMQVINIANDIFDAIDNNFGFDNDNLKAFITEEQNLLLKQVITNAEFSIKQEQ